jgi:hypothetical protein
MIENNPPEIKENTPEFLMVKFDEKGQPIGARPMKDPSNLPKLINVKFGGNEDEKGQIYSFVEPTSPSILSHNKDLIRKILIFVVKNNETLREEIKQSNYLLEQEIENSQKRLNLQDDYNEKIKEKLTVMNVSLNDLSEKMNKLNDVDLLRKKLEDMDLSISDLTKEMTGTKTNEKEIVQILKSFLERISMLNRELQNQKQFKEDLLIDQEKFHKTITTEFLKIKKMLRKTRKRQIKPQKAKVIRLLKENFNIEPFTKVLVVTDKRNSTFGNILYESMKKLNGSSTYVVTENRTDETLLDNPIVEAIKQSNHVFIVGKYSPTQIKEITVTFMNQVKIISIKRSLKYSIL